MERNTLLIAIIMSILTSCYIMLGFINDSLNNIEASNKAMSCYIYNRDGNTITSAVEDCINDN